MVSQCLRNADGASAAHSAHSPVGKLDLLGVGSVPFIRKDFSLEESRHECIDTWTQAHACFLFIFLNLLFIYLIFGCTESYCCSQAFSSRGEWGLLSSCGVQASSCGGFSRCGVPAAVIVACGLSCCSTQTQLPWGMCDLVGPGIEPASPAL